MRFMLMVKAGTEAAMAPTPALLEAIGKLTQEMIAAGVLFDTGGFQDSKTATQVKLSGGKVSVTDGPFTEANEVIGGYAIVDVKSKDEAIVLAKKFLQVHADAMGPGYSAETEIRRMYIQSDFEGK